MPNCTKVSFCAIKDNFILYNFILFPTFIVPCKINFDKIINKCFNILKEEFLGLLLGYFIYSIGQLKADQHKLQIDIYRAIIEKKTE